MTRLDPNGKDKAGPKTTVQMGPSADEVNGGPAPEDVDRGPLTSAASYNQRVKARQKVTKSLKGKGKPLGGAPPIPSEKTAAIASTMAPIPVFDDPEPEETQDPQEFRVPHEPPQALGGVGSAFDVNQKIARGEVDRPVSLKEAKNMAKAKKKQPEAPSQLSPETVAGIKRAQEELEEEEAVHETPELEDPTEAQLAEAEEEMIRRDTPFDFESIQQQQQVLMSKERKRDIESRLVDLDIADLIVKREIQQDIPVVPGKLTYTLRTFNQQEHLFCLSYVYENPGSVTYAEEFLNTCKLVCSLVAINGAHLPRHVNEKGELDKKLFQKKMDQVSSFPVHMMADLSVQAIWFNQRVNDLFSVGNLKNG